MVIYMNFFSCCVATNYVTIYFAENLRDTFCYLDKINVTGHCSPEHDRNIDAFLTVVRRRNFMLNESKTISSVGNLNIIGYVAGNMTIKFDAERMSPLQELSPPQMLRHYFEFWARLRIRKMD